MDILDKIGNMASETYKFTTEKTSKLAREAKLKMKINEYKSKISDVYEEIGKIIYQKHIREEDINISEDIEKYCQDIDTYSKEIEDYRMELLNIKDKKQCIKCYAEIELDSNFCQYCGEEQPKSEVKEAEVIIEEEIETTPESEEEKENNE